MKESVIVLSQNKDRGRIEQRSSRTRRACRSVGIGRVHREVRRAQMRATRTLADVRDQIANDLGLFRHEQDVDLVAVI